jgi:hypothetical protein
MIDSGHLYNGQQGFIGKGARLKGGKIRFSPNQYIKVNATGSSLRDSIVPLPANAPSPVLFNLLSLLISYSERVGSVTDTMVGENPGQNTPAYNMSAMLEQGLQVFNGIFKRVYRSMRGEFRKLYSLNSVYLDDQQYFEYHDSDASVMRTDYTADPKDLIPAADPNAFSNKEKMEKAMMIKQNAMQTPGYNPIEVELRWLDAMDIPDARQLFPLQQDENGQQTYVFPPQPDPKLEIEKADMQRRTLEGKVRGEADLARAEADFMVAEAKVALMYAQAQDIGDQVTLDRLKLIMDDLKDKRKTMVDLEKIEVELKKAEKANAGTTEGTKAQITEWTENPVTLYLKEKVEEEIEMLEGAARTSNVYKPFEPEKTQELLATLNAAIDGWELVLEALNGDMEDLGEYSSEVQDEE